MTKPQRILVIEDDPDTAANLSDILELDEYEVELAGTLTEALQREQDDDLVAVCPNGAHGFDMRVDTVGDEPPQPDSTE